MEKNVCFIMVVIEVILRGSTFHFDVQGAVMWSIRTDLLKDKIINRLINKDIR
jgi:hypothetical protein